MTTKSAIKVAPLVLAYATLMALLAASWALAYKVTGRWSLVIALGIAALKAAVVVRVFMELGSRSSVVKTYAAVALFWLVILFGLGYCDYLGRL